MTDTQTERDEQTDRLVATRNEANYGRPHNEVPAASAVIEYTLVCCETRESFIGNPTPDLLLGKQCYALDIVLKAANKLVRSEFSSKARRLLTDYVDVQYFNICWRLGV